MRIDRSRERPSSANGNRGWGKPKEMHHSEVDDNKTLLKVVNEIVHVYETREQIEFTDQTPLLELTVDGSKKTN